MLGLHRVQFLFFYSLAGGGVYGELNAVEAKHTKKFVSIFPQEAQVMQVETHDKIYEHHDRERESV